MRKLRKIKKAYEITDAKIQFVSLVDKAANKKPFLLKKEDEGKAVFTTYGKIIKADTNNHYVTGIVYEPMTEDCHGNYMTAEEITKAAYWFAKNGDKVDLQHSFEPIEDAAVVESWIAKVDFELNGENIKEGTWLITAEVPDNEIWNNIESGKITGFSMGGLGNYSEEDTELNNIKKADEEEEDKIGLLARLAKVLGISQDKPVEKAGKSISGRNKEVLQNIYDNLGTFLASFEDKEKEEIVKENKEAEKIMTKSEMESVIEKSLSAALKKAFETEEQKNEEEKQEESSKERDAAVSREELKNMIDEAVAAALKSKEEAPAEEQIQKMVFSAVQKAVDPILKSKGLPVNLNGTEIEKSEKTHYLHGIL